MREADAGVGDRDTVTKRTSGQEILPAFVDMALDHDADDAVFAACELAGDIGAWLRADFLAPWKETPMLKPYAVSPCGLRAGTIIRRGDPMVRPDNQGRAAMHTVIQFGFGGVLYAIACRRLPAGTVQFVTPGSAALQVGVMDRPTGYQVAAHTHPADEVRVRGGSEFLFVESGRIRVTLFDEAWREIGECELGAGDHIVMLRGGHAVTVLESVRLIEVKQGPVSECAPTKLLRDSVKSSDETPA